MNAHLRKDMYKLRSQILRIAIAVEEILKKSFKALNELSIPLAEEVVKGDYEIDKMEVEIEEECLKILALHQPVASDLRFVITVLKINNELEHIADMAVNIANRIHYIAEEDKSVIPFDMDKMTTRAIHMLKESIDGFLNSDEYIAIRVCQDDEVMDEENRKSYSIVKDEIKKNPNRAMMQINYLLVSKALERIGDLCTNIAEDVIYMKRSIIVRHNLEESIKEISENLTL